MLLPLFWVQQQTLSSVIQEQIRSLRGGADILTGGSRSDTFIFTTGDTGITLDTADTITDFSTGTDKIDIATVGNYVEADGVANANIAAFITDADASLPTTSIDIYAEYNFNGEGNTLVVIDEDKRAPLIPVIL